MGFKPKGKSKKWKKGDIALIRWESMYGPPMRGKGLARCKVVSMRMVPTFRGRKRLQLRVRDPKGRLWWTVDWHRKGSRE